MRPVRMNVAVRASGVAVRYGEIVALGPSDFVIEKGGVTAVIGPNGSGKSTLLNVIAGLVEPSAGSVEIDVAPGRLAYVMQSTKVNENLPVTVREVVAMGRYATLGPYRPMGPTDREAVEAAMERLDLTDLAGRHLHDLSGGQRQRVLVAQGLAQDHDLLLLDEPLTGLDIVTAQAIDQVIHNERSDGCTVIMTTHDLSEARSADNVILLAGRVVASGPPAKVLTEESLVEAYGPTLLHVERGRVFLDDPAHSPVAGRHSHQQRSIHTESDPSERHGR
ncbi:MAG TPA: zinc ABC transporter ATP-binding protein AztA [Acidimicrobiia bacterium]|jgi:manganese transport system ATP-binding protein|nr:zinc ABC transporter ATP-binding protein AztA [Acidimicrobiia bacterium]